MKVTTPMLSTPWPSGSPAITWRAQIQPVPNHRPRVYRGGNNQRAVRTIKPGGDAAFESELQLLWFAAGIRKPLEGVLAVVMEFSGNTVNRWGHRAPRPDLSNLIKAVEDAGNGVLWEDDRQIVQTAASIRRWDRDAAPLVALWVWSLTAWPCGAPDAELSTARSFERPGLPPIRSRA